MSDTPSATPNSNDELVQAAEAAQKAAKGQTPKTDETEPRGGIVQNTHQVGRALVKSALTDGRKAGALANEAFATGFARTRQQGTQAMLKVAKTATDSTAAAIASIDIDELEEECETESPFTLGAISLLG